MATQIHEHKSVNEDITIEFDMLSRLTVGETVATAAVASVVASGSSLVPLTLAGMPTITNSVVGQRVSGGAAGVIYTVACSVRTSLNNILINEAKVAVISDNALIPPAAT